MENGQTLEQFLSNTESIINSLNQKLTKLQADKQYNDKLNKDTQDALESVKEQLFDLTGINVDSDPGALEEFVKEVQEESVELHNDLMQISSYADLESVENNDYSLSDQDIEKLNGIIDKYAIPITQ